MCDLQSGGEISSISSNSSHYASHQKPSNEKISKDGALEERRVTDARSLEQLDKLRKAKDESASELMKFELEAFGKPAYVIPLLQMRARVANTMAEYWATSEAVIRWDFENRRGTGSEVDWKLCLAEARERTQNAALAAKSAELAAEKAAEKAALVAKKAALTTEVESLMTKCFKLVDEIKDLEEKGATAKAAYVKSLYKTYEEQFEAYLTSLTEASVALLRY